MFAYNSEHLLFIDRCYSEKCMILDILSFVRTTCVVKSLLYFEAIEFIALNSGNLDFSLKFLQLVACLKCSNED